MAIFVTGCAGYRRVELKADPADRPAVSGETPVAPGDEIRITTVDGERRECIVESVGPDVIEVSWSEVAEPPRIVPLDTIRELEIRQGLPPSAKIGLVAWAVGTGIVIGYMVYHKREFSPSSTE